MIRHIERYEADIERLQFDKDQLIERLNDLSQNVAQRIQLIEELELVLKDQDTIISIMNRKIKEKQLARPQRADGSGPVYMQPKGDILDDMLNMYVNAANCGVPIRKLGNGFYLFGTKKIWAKSLNGKLVIKVGGGYMVIEEFIATYADSEMAKISKLTDEQLQALAARSGETITAQVDPNKKINGPVRKSATAGAGGRLSPKLNMVQKGRNTFNMANK